MEANSEQAEEAFHMVCGGKAWAGVEKIHAEEWHAMRRGGVRSQASEEGIHTVG